MESNHEFEHSEVINGQPMQQEKKAGKTPVVLIAGIAVAVVLIIAAVLFLSRGNKGSEEAQKISGIVDVDGLIYFVKENGETIILKGEALEGSTAADFKRIIVLDKDGNIYETDGEGEDKKVLVKDALSIEKVTENGIIYSVESEDKKEASYDEVMQAIVDDHEDKITLTALKKVMKQYGYKETAKSAKEAYKILIGKEYEEEAMNEYCKYSFEEKGVTTIGTGKFVAAGNTLNVLFQQDGSVYYMAEKDTDKTKLGSYDDDADIHLQAVWDDNKYAVWSVTKGSETSVYIAVDGDAEKLDVYEYEDDDDAYSYLDDYDFNLNYWTYYSEEEKAVVFANAESKKVYVKKEGKDVEKISFNDEMTSLYVHSVDGTAQISAESFYIEESKGVKEATLYYVGADMEKSKVLSNAAKICSVNGGTIYYIDEEDNLYRAALDGDTISDEEKLASDVKTASASSDGEAVYYIKDYISKDSTGTLYAAEKGKDKEKISEDVYWVGLTLSEDGKTVFYEKEPIKVGSTYTYKNTLVSYTIGKENNIIAEDVLRWRNVNYSKEEGIDKIIYLKHTEDKGSDIFGSYYYYDGEESNKIIEKVEY